MLNMLLIFAKTPCKPDSPGFFSLQPWWKYLPKEDFDKVNGSCDLRFFHFPRGGSGTNDIALVLLAVIDDLLRLAGLVAVAFVIYGGIKLILSQGEPAERAAARTTIFNALIGVAIAMIAVVLVSFIGSAIKG